MKNIKKNNNTLQWISKKVVGIICDEPDYVHLMGNANLEYITADNCLEKVDIIDYMLVISPKYGLYGELIEDKFVILSDIMSKMKTKKNDLPTVLIFGGLAKDRFGYRNMYDKFDIHINRFIPPAAITPKIEATLFNYPHISVINPNYANPIGTFTENIGFYSSDVYNNTVDKVTNFRNESIARIKELNYNVKIVETDDFALNYLQRLEEMKTFSYHLLLQNTLAKNNAMGPESANVMAMGKLAVSNYSSQYTNFLYSGYCKFFPNDISDIFQQTDTQIKEQRLEGIRIAYKNHLAEHLLQAIEGRLLNQKFDQNFKLYVISDNANAFANQTYNDFSIISCVDDIPESEKLTLVTSFDHTKPYKVSFLEDLINGFKYTNATRVQAGTDSEFEYVEEKTDNCLSMWVHNASEEVIFNIQNNVLVEKQLQTENEYLLTIIIPVYNNGEFLKYRSVNSIMQSMVFDQIKVLLIDDGSTDDFTIKICEELVSEYDNIELFKFDDGGSGSASRPRNKGIELAVTPYIAFLDPDNEAFPNVYEKMLNIIGTEDVDYVQGNTLVYQNEERLTPNVHYRELQKYSGPEKLIADEFHPRNVQDSIFKTSFIKDNDLEMEVGVTGEDTLFNYEVLLRANKVAYINDFALIYHAMRVGSVTNVVNLGLMEKSYKVEVIKHRKLKEYNVISEYQKTILTQQTYRVMCLHLYSQPESNFEKGFQILKDFIDINGVEVYPKSFQQIYYSQSREDFLKRMKEFQEDLSLITYNELHQQIADIYAEMDSLDIPYTINVTPNKVAKQSLLAKIKAKMLNKSAPVKDEKELTINQKNAKMKQQVMDLKMKILMEMRQQNK